MFRCLFYFKIKNRKYMEKNSDYKALMIVFIITLMLHQIVMISNKVKLAEG